MKKTLFFLIPAIILASFSVFFRLEVDRPKNPDSQEKIFFRVENGQNFLKIAENLEKEGLIKNRILFDFYVALTGKQRKLQAGKYELSPSLNVPAIAKKIVSGDTAKIIVTIPEGFTLKQIEERLNLNLPGDNIEGFLFPDTYQFPLGVSGEAVVETMRENFDRKLSEEIKEKIVGRGKTILEIVKMASLLEKEVRTKEDKKLVSGILWKRLEVNMPLQVDAAPETYQRLGLPQAPISNPGLESIFAAVYPENSDFWYYLSSRDGRTIFSKTLTEHNSAREKYLK